MALQFNQLDSYILKHKINYNTSNNSPVTDEPYKMLFIDYDLARKSQPSNADNFNTVYDHTPYNLITSIDLKYYNDTYTINIDGEGKYSNVFNNVNVADDPINNTQSYYINNTELPKFIINDTIEINVYQYYNTSGYTQWTHNGLANEIWYVSGVTTNNTIWEATGITSNNGYTNGYTDWNVYEKIPILTYKTKILNKIGNMIVLKRDIQKYMYNNFLSTPNLFYEITTLNHAIDNDLYNINLKLKKSPYGGYISVDTDNPLYSFIFDPIRNPNDIYFNYDKFTITINATTTIVYSFNTNCLYNKYNLSAFFDQLDVSGYTNASDIMIPDNISTIPYTYTNQSTIQLELSDINNITIFKKYTYVRINTNLSTYTVLLTNILDGIITVEVPIGITNGEIIQSIENVSTIDEISNILEMCYININNGFYKKREKYNINNIYLAYADVINIDDMNSTIRQALSGIIFENANNKMTLKIYNPSEATTTDKRLTYMPFEITRIGYDKMTNIPIQIYDYSLKFLFNIIDGNNMETEMVIDSNQYSDIVITGNIIE